MSSDVDADIGTFDGPGILDYLEGKMGEDAVAIFIRGSIDVVDRCTGTVDGVYGRLRCTNKGVDRWVSNGVLVWNRCQLCLGDRVLVKENFGKVHSVLNVDGGKTRFKAE